MSRIRPNLPLGSQTFEIIRTRGDIYVDKTQLVHKLVTTETRSFLSRPRRFGKSTLVTTLQALFEGRRDLFEGLWITEQSDYEFEPCPVFLLDMGFAGNPRSAEILEELLNDQVNHLARKFNVPLTSNLVFSRFRELITSVYELTGKRIVILVDEYDKPILDSIGKDHLDAVRGTLSQFYTVIKSADNHVQFVFLTGVSKFSKVSVFSGLNNLTDLTMHPDYATICGYTQEELEQNFGPWIEDVAEEQEMSRDEVLGEIKAWYNGYRFTSKDLKVYNPASTLNLFHQKRFSAFWFETGTPTMLVTLLQTQRYPIDSLEQIKASEEDFSVFDVENLRVAPLFFQTGYLTIIDYDKRRKRYTLGYPNLEVKEAFVGRLFLELAQSPQDRNTVVFDLVDAVEAQNVDEFMGVLRSFFASIPYDIQRNRSAEEKEHYYQSLFYVIFALLGVQIRVEERTNQGRIDAVIEIEDAVFLFEFKIATADPDTVCEEALTQIKDHQYPDKFKKTPSTKKVWLVGVAFDPETRGIPAWKVEAV